MNYTALFTLVTRAKQKSIAKSVRIFSEEKIKLRQGVSLVANCMGARALLWELGLQVLISRCCAVNNHSRLDYKLAHPANRRRPGCFPKYVN